MKKRILIIMLLSLSLLLSACGHEHTWQAATCTSAKFCQECGETEGEAFGHSWIAASCLEPKYCSVCLQAIGDPLGHSWIEATCKKPRHCTNCNTTEGAILEHSWNAATCTEPETCVSCGTTHGDALGHTIETWNIMVDATCTAAGSEFGICSVCEETIEQEIPIIAHTPGEWEITIQPTSTQEGTHVKSCTVCGEQLESEQFKLSAEEIEKLYKDGCESIPYNSLARSPGEYKGKQVKFTGRVVQVCSEAKSILYYSTYRVATSGRYDNVVYIYVDNYGSGSRILEGDKITFYGEFDGLYTYETVMGASVTIPSIKVEYIS